MLRPLSPWLVLLNVEAVDSTVVVYLVHAVLVAPFSVSLCNSFLLELISLYCLVGGLCHYKSYKGSCNALRCMG